jgi:hypothetical protein
MTMNAHTVRYLNADGTYSYFASVCTLGNEFSDSKSREMIRCEHEAQGHSRETCTVIVEYPDAIDVLLEVIKP